MLKLFNTLTRCKEEFTPLKGKTVGLYTCGPTVYDYAHLGNLRTYLFEDWLRRTLRYSGFRVKHVMNITDVGHLTSDADAGEDKMQQALDREHLPPTVESLRTLAERYTAAFLEDLERLNILRPHAMPKATEYVHQMVELIQMMVKGDYAYETKLAVYYDVSKFANYTALSRQPLKDKVTGARDEVTVDPDKRQPADFALWFKLAGKNQNHVMHWPSPWGEGFPGWHIECSAMSRALLGFPFDIHCGGVDHVSVHHTNEIAQNAAVYDGRAVQVWMHGEFLDLGNLKMAKSAGTFLRLTDVVGGGIDPLAYRALCLQTHYRQKLNFTWEALEAAAQGLKNLRRAVATWDAPKIGCAGFEADFLAALEDDLNLPKALGVVWDMVNAASLPSAGKRRSIEKFDAVLGLGLAHGRAGKIPREVQQLVKAREAARAGKQWNEADRLRAEVEAVGFEIEDTAEGPRVAPKS